MRIATGRSKQRSGTVRESKPLTKRKFGIIKDSRGQSDARKKGSGKNAQKTVQVYTDESEVTAAAGLEGDWKRNTVPDITKIRGKENRTEATKWTDQAVSSTVTKKQPALFIERRPEEDLDEKRTITIAKAMSLNHIQSLAYNRPLY